MRCCLGTKKRLPPFLISFIEMHTDSNYHPKRQKHWENLELGLNIVSWDPSASLEHTCSFLPYRLHSSPAFVMHSWWHIKILSTVLSAVTSFSWMDILFVENTAWCSAVWAEMNAGENLSYVMSVRSEINFPVEMSNYSNLSSRRKSFWQSVFLKNPAIQLAWIRWPIRD